MWMRAGSKFKLSASSDAAARSIDFQFFSHLRGERSGGFRTDC